MKHKVGDVVVVAANPFADGFECGDEYIGELGVVSFVCDYHHDTIIEHAGYGKYDFVRYVYTPRQLINLGPL